MLGKGPTRLKNERRVMKVKEKILASFPWSGKKSQQRESERTRESSPREVKTRGKRKGGGERQGKTTGVKGDTIFYSQSES